MPQKKKNFLKNIFINCPFDSEYKKLLRPLLFVVLDCGFEPRIASESSDSGQVRVDKIKKLIKESCYSIHDISRIEALKEGDLPRFNMPFELGLDLGCKDFGPGKLTNKKCLILEKEQYRYHKVLSDISGNDIKAHNDDPETLVSRVRDWIIETTGVKVKSGSTAIWQRFNEFYGNLTITAQENGFSDRDIEEMSVVEFIEFIKAWIKSSKL